MKVGRKYSKIEPKVGRNFTSERGEGVKGEVKNISLHWLQGIFETVPYCAAPTCPDAIVV